MPLVERRYAEALIGLSSQAGAIDEYQQELTSIVSLFDTVDEFKFFLLNPEIDTETKKAVIDRTFAGKTRAELVNFIKLLLDKGRIKNLPGILDEFIVIADSLKNVLNMTIVSAAPLEDAQIARIKEKYRGIYSAASVKIDVEVDPKLIGGILIKIGDKVVDGSIAGRLSGLKSLLTQ